MSVLNLTRPGGVPGVELLVCATVLVARLVGGEKSC
ncbi:hypothetical protein SAMN05421507_103218 [Lentzea jiangxiensis]|uniref:Uncharacterized protein n=1 Tax=Lentzea jiangxiensis TaxID=641025 RepID=A0A1H0L7U2_9PSEU|nr:hypothetical protein SAMN05421507_103218 [Lentzea jiangxiensis]